MRISDWSSDVCSSDLLLHRLAAMRHAIEQDVVADEHGIAAAQPLLPDAGGEAVRVDVGADVVERVAEGRRVLHYRAQRTVYIVALARRQTPADIEIGRESCRERVCQDV